MNLDTAVYGKDQYIVFRLAEHTYCIYSFYVRELINLKNFSITKNPLYSGVYNRYNQLKG